MLLRTERRGRVQVISLNRPEARNALHPDLIARLSRTLATTNDDDEIRVVILTGAGEAFCAGLDLKHLVTLDPDASVEYMRSAFSLFRQVHELRQPVVAAVNGPAMAGGFDLAAFSDIRLCSTTAKFAQTEILLGLTQIPYPVYKVIGLGRAREMALTGRAISAEEAHRIGLVTAIHPPADLPGAALRLAKELASRPPGALFETKRLTSEVIGLDFDSAMERMFDVICSRLRSDEYRTAVDAYVSRMPRRKR